MAQEAQKIDRNNITGLILAGGRGSRMNDSDKGLQVLHDTPLVQHVLHRLRPQVGAVLVSANRNLEQYSALGATVVSDTLAGYAGPLAGLQAGLAQCKTEFLACVPCDSPALPPDLVERLQQALSAAGAQLAYAATGSGTSHRTHPVFCLLRANLLESLQACLDAGGRKVSAWQATLKSVEVHFANAAAFHNINSFDELRQFEDGPGASS